MSSLISQDFGLGLLLVIWEFISEFKPIITWLFLAEMEVHEHLREAQEVEKEKRSKFKDVES